MSTYPRSDIRFIKLALQLAKRGIGQTGSNPSVGCVIVKDNKIVGRGVTGANGKPHAETKALIHAGSMSVGASMFVTLEPCSHFGQTPPCVESIIDSRISRVVCPLIDPDPRVSGAGFEKLQKAGIKVDFIPIASTWAKEIIRGFISRIEKGRPFITVKLGMSVDGKIASRSGKSNWITNKRSRAQSHLLRAKNDAILVGTKTFIHDNPTLNVRGTLKTLLSPLRIFLDHDLKVFPSELILKNLSNYPSIIVCGENPNKKNLKTWKNANVEILKITAVDKDLVLESLFKILGARGINSLLIEGGGKLVKSLVKSDLIDELIVYRSGVIIGSDGVPSVFKFQKISEEINAHPKMKLHSVKRYGDNVESIWRRL